MDYKAAFQYHLERNADVTLISTNIEQLGAEHDGCFRIEADEFGWVHEITNEKTNRRLFTGVYIINKELLLSLVDQCIARHQDYLFIDGIKQNLTELNVQHFEYDGYSAFINTIESYYRHNMNLLSEANYKELFYKQPFVRTKVSNQPRHLIVKVQM
ncbi:hypothetical protein ACI2OX_06985 [Bacillus sp. N9]